MARFWLETFLGRIGNYILDFLQGYYFYIVPILALYGIFLAISSFNFKRIERKIDAEIVRQAEGIIARMPGISYVTLVEKINIPWVDIVYEYSFFPYVSQEADLWVQRTLASTVRKMIMQNNNKIKFILARNGILLEDEDKGIRKNVYLDYVQRLTKRKT
ncbi:MAG: hypothetical protein ACQEP5_08260 [Actinomycetota bacterium]